MCLTPIKADYIHVFMSRAESDPAERGASPRGFPERGRLFTLRELRGEKTQITIKLALSQWWEVVFCVVTLAGCLAALAELLTRLLFWSMAHFWEFYPWEWWADVSSILSLVLVMLALHADAPSHVQPFLQTCNFTRYDLQCFPVNVVRFTKWCYFKTYCKLLTQQLFSIAF